MFSHAGTGLMITGLQWLPELFRLLLRLVDTFCYKEIPWFTTGWWVAQYSRKSKHTLKVDKSETTHAASWQSCWTWDIRPKAGLSIGFLLKLAGAAWDSDVSTKKWSWNSAGVYFSTQKVAIRPIFSIRLRDNIIDKRYSWFWIYRLFRVCFDSCEYRATHHPVVNQEISLYKKVSTKLWQRSEQLWEPL